jgi:hypothetical protein
MGSSGTGHFSDYPGTMADKPGGAGGSSGEDQCNQQIMTALEDVERCDFFINHSRLPDVGTPIQVSLAIRLTVITNEGETIGFLPTQYNYLAACIKAGRNYQGVVASSSLRPISKVQVEIMPE